ncbi:cation diffusion facilitator family transporter [Enhydrobacter sp.]|uniref:cation diffusion facilitator family transporter n=1 Tax=Enhydrobacter sp. TaxID=1894999 RepID=UPI002613B348|nr:cation diffusion facilitator family transporter [Enhydrobacter sp.]
MRQATLASMSVATILVVAKGIAWLVTDSVGMLSSLVDSALDLVSSLITFIAVRQALVPADEDHRFGHGKAEALAGVAQAGFIAASAGGLVLTVADRFLHPRPVQAESTGLLVSAFAVLLTFALMLFQTHVVRRTNSIAIGADKAHYTTDFVTNIAVGAGILAASRLDQPLIDLAVALGVAVYLVTGAWTIGRTSIDVLMDRELPEQDRARILDIVHRHPGVRSVHDLRTRSSGLTQFIQLHVVLHPTMSLGRAHVIGDSIEAAIREAYPQAEVILHIDPWNDDEPRLAPD